MKFKINFDKIGSYVATTCLVHCLVMPILITLIPFAGLFSVSLNLFEIVIMLCALFFGIISICAGFKKHRKYSGPFLISLGLFLLLTGSITHHTDLEYYHIPIMIMASAVLIIGHLTNNTLCNKYCNKCKI